MELIINRFAQAGRQLLYLTGDDPPRGIALLHKLPEISLYLGADDRIGAPHRRSLHHLPRNGSHRRLMRPNSRRPGYNRELRQKTPKHLISNGPSSYPSRRLPSRTAPTPTRIPMPVLHRIRIIGVRRPVDR
jgi:hypothetical protein